MWVGRRWAVRRRRWRRGVVTGEGRAHQRRFRGGNCSRESARSYQTETAVEGAEEVAAAQGVAAEGATEETAVGAGAARTVVVAEVAVAGEGVAGEGVAEEATAQAARHLACAWYRAPHRLERLRSCLRHWSSESYPTGWLQEKRPRYSEPLSRNHRRELAGLWPEQERLGHWRLTRRRLPDRCCCRRGPRQRCRGRRR